MTGDVDMRHYVDVRLEELKDYFCVRHDALSVVVALSKDSLEILIRALSLKIDELEKKEANLEGRASQTSVYIGYALAIIAIVVAIVGLIK